MCRNAETLLQVSVIREPFVGPRLSPGDAGSAAAARSGFEALRTLRERPAAQRPRRPRAAPAARPRKERLRGGTARGDGAAAVPSEQGSAPSRPGQAARRRGSPSGPVPTEDEEEEKEAAPFPQPPPRGTHSNTCSEVRSSWRRARGSPGAAPLLHPAVPGRAAPPAAAAPAQRGRAAGCRRARSAGAQSPRGAAVTRRSRSPWESRGGRQAPPRVPLSAAAQRVGRPRPEPHPAGAAGTTWQRGAPRALPFRWLRGFAVTLPVSLTAAGRAAAAAFLEPFPPRFEAWLKGTAQYGWRRTDFGTHLKAFRTCGRGSPQRVSQTPPLWPGRN